MAMGTSVSVWAPVVVCWRRVYGYVCTPDVLFVLYDMATVSGAEFKPVHRGCHYCVLRRYLRSLEIRRPL